MDLKNLIEKTEIQRKTILELIKKAETKEEVLTEMAVERFLKGFLTDLKNVDKHLIKQYAINGVSQQRELLVAYEMYCRKTAGCDEDKIMCEILADKFLSTNCG